jgi:hypothetical protein
LFAAGLAEVWRSEGSEELLTICEDAKAADGAVVRVLGQSGQRGMALWLESRNSAAQQVRELTLKLPPLVEGEYRVAWLDTKDGTFVHQEIYSAPAKRIDQPPPPTILRAPAFKQDIGCIVTEEKGRRKK